MRIVADYHTHTCWSHAKGTIEENYRAARDLGLEAVGIAEHGPSLVFAGTSRHRWPLLARAVAAEKTWSGTRLLFNIEANVISLSGQLDVPPAVRDQLDMVLVGLHPRVVPRGLDAWWAFYGLRWLSLLSRSWRHKLYDTFTQALVNCLSTQPVDVLVHPGYGLPIDTREVVAACARHSTLVEINCRHSRPIAQDIRIAAANPDVIFVLGSDAHHPREVGRFDACLELVAALGLEQERVVNVVWEEKSRQ